MYEQITSEQILKKTLQYVAPLPSQQGYAKALASIFAMHIHRNELIDDGFSPDELPATSALVVAPTGQGKTFLLRKMAETLGLNIIIIDCSTVAAEGWKGLSLSQRLAVNLEEVGDIRVFERSVLMFDEFDKLRRWGTQYDQGNSMVNILQMFNNGKVAIETKKETRHVDISRFTVLFGGAFEGLDNIIRERVCPKPKIGFSSEVAAQPLSTADLLQLAAIEDLAQYGLMQELLGRIGTILSISPLGKEDYRQLLNAKNGSVRKRYENYLYNLYGVSFEITDSAVEYIAEQCTLSQTGARAATPLVDKWMREAIVNVENNYGVSKVVLDACANGCYVRHESGQRGYAFRNPARAEVLKNLPCHIVKAKDPSGLVKKLLRYYRNANGCEEVLPQLEPFLECSMKYLFEKARPDERTFDSLEKFVRVTRRGYGKSAFDIIMGDEKYDLLPEYRSFIKGYSSGTQQNLVMALNTIMEYLQRAHGVCQVRFELFASRKSPPKN